MEKITLGDILSGFSLTKINDNFQKIADAINDKLLSKDEAVLKGDLDANGYHIYNLAAPTGDSHAARLKDVKNAIDGLNGQTANLISFEPSYKIAANNVQGAVEEVYDDVVAFTTRTAIHAKSLGVVGDGVVDDYPAFIAAISTARQKNVPLDISNLKIYLASQNASINLDGVRVIGNGKVAKPPLDTAYVTGTDKAVEMWTSVKGGAGSAVFSRYNGSIFTGASFPVQNLSIFCDYNKTLSQGFAQTTPTTYPGWSQALLDTNVDIYYCGKEGISLSGGLELVSVRNINVWFCGGIALAIGTTAGINCPIEYLHFDESCSFIYGKLGNVWLNGFRRNVKFEGCLVNGAGQYDVVGGTIANQSAIVPNIRVTSLAAGVYGGVNHSGSDQLEVERCYGEAVQNILKVDGAPLNSLEFKHNTLIPWDNTKPKNLLHVGGNLYRLRTSGNGNIDSVFYINVESGVVSAAADYLIEEGTVTGGVVHVGSKPLDKALTPAPSWHQQSPTLGDGTAGTFTYNVAINQQTAVNTAAATAIWAISANFQDSQFDRNETVLMAVTRVSSGNYVGQVLVPPASTLLFSAAPTINAAGVLQIPLTLYSRARVTRLDMQPLILV